MTSDSDYMSVNDSLLRTDQRRPLQPQPGNNNEPIYHTLDDDDNSTDDKLPRTTATTTGNKKKEQTVYINADLVRRANLKV